jgi:Zn-finger nucleic acid-binding protein
VRNDVDLESKHEFTIKAPYSDRICPHCDVALQTIDLKVNGHLYIERCSECFGLFFDPGEIDILLNSTVSNTETINLRHIQSINQDRYQAKKVKYIKCPVCKMMMSRVNFGYQSGVIIDQCREHGIWLDNGEITHLMEWKKAGGQVLSQQKTKQKIHPNQRRKPAAVLPQSKMLSFVETPSLLSNLSAFVSELFD